MFLCSGCARSHLNDFFNVYNEILSQRRIFHPSTSLKYFCLFFSSPRDFSILIKISCLFVENCDSLDAVGEDHYKSRFHHHFFGHMAVLVGVTITNLSFYQIFKSNLLSVGSTRTACLPGTRRHT